MKITVPPWPFWIDPVSTDLGIIPSLFWFEVRNTLLVGERRKRLIPEQTALFLSNLAILPFEIDHRPHESTLLDLARQQLLTVYDAAYLELALRRKLPLATVDRDLIRAAQTVGVVVWRSGM